MATLNNPRHLSIPLTCRETSDHSILEGFPTVQNFFHTAARSATASAVVPRVAVRLINALKAALEVTGCSKHVDCWQTKNRPPPEGQAKQMYHPELQLETNTDAASAPGWPVPRRPRKRRSSFRPGSCTSAQCPDSRSCRRSRPPRRRGRTGP